MKKREKKFLEIELEIYRTHVVVTWEPKIHKIANWAKKHGVKITDEWIKTIIKTQEGANGFCAALGDDNTDTLVWIKKRPAKCSEYGVLYHELYHAVDRISDTHNLKNETEARAYIYEFLITKCNQYFWK